MIYKNKKKLRMSVSFRKKYFGPPFAFLFPFCNCIVPYIYVARLIEKYNFCENFSAFVEFSGVLNFLRSNSVLRRGFSLSTNESKLRRRTKFARPIVSDCRYPLFPRLWRSRSFPPRLPLFPFLKRYFSTCIRP